MIQVHWRGGVMIEDKLPDNSPLVVVIPPRVLNEGLQRAYAAGRDRGWWQGYLAGVVVGIAFWVLPEVVKWLAR